MKSDSTNNVYALCPLSLQHPDTTEIFFKHLSSETLSGRQTVVRVLIQLIAVGWYSLNAEIITIPVTARPLGDEYLKQYMHSVHCSFE